MNKKSILGLIGILALVVVVVAICVGIATKKKSDIKENEPVIDTKTEIPVFDGFVIDNKTEYGRDGKISKYTEFKYDNYGICTEEKVYTDKGGALLFTTEYELDYSIGGLPVKSVTRDSKGKSEAEISVFEYNEDHMLVGEKCFLEDELISSTEFDAYGKIAREFEYNEGKISLTIEYEYDVNGVVCAQKETDSKGNVKDMMNVTLDSVGRVSEIISGDKDNYIKTKYSYNSQGKVDKIINEADGNIEERVYSYNKDGLVTLIEFKSEGAVTGTYSYTYNENRDRTSFFSKDANGYVYYGYEATYRKFA